MNRLVVINLGSGNLLDGCAEVTAQISLTEGDRHPTQCRGSLPPAIEIEKLYKNWQLLYREFYRQQVWRSARAIKIEPGGVTHFSEVEFRDLARQVKTRLNDWLSSESFYAIDRRLSRLLDPADEIRVIIETNDDLLRRLPWHFWNFFEDYPKAEIALSTLEYGKVKPLTQIESDRVRILAILGDSDGIDIQTDRRVIESLPGAAPLFLESPHRQELDDRLWSERGWDILFFAGHSQTEEETGTGRIYINAKESLTLEQLRNALKKAIARGLKLAIFNSCDGLGLARELADLYLPHAIVMREQVPDAVAQEFFRHFLAAFSGGQSLFLAVREARERLEKLESEYPCATWLPAICQNPAAEPTTWQDWCGWRSRDLPRKTNKRPLQAAFCLSLAVTTLILGVRQLGMLEGWELQAFDRAMQLRPEEEQDRRLLIVTVTEEDFQLPEQQNRKGSLSDLSLARLFEKLAPLQPRAIGLDIYRDFAVSSEREDLAVRLKRDNNFFAVCKASDRAANRPGIAPPPEVQPERQGFSDAIEDPDGILRRHLIAIQPDPTSPCTAPYALSSQLAFHYLNKEGIAIKYTPTGELQLGNIVFKRLPDPRTNTLLEYWRSRQGGYRQVDAWGYQILLNYRSHRSPANIAPSVTLKEILTGQVDPKAFRDRIVLIGVTASSTNDLLSTPYSANRENERQIPGVMAQAQMVSQILSAVLDGRPLLSVLTVWQEAIWIWIWSLLAGVFVGYCRSRVYATIAIAVALGIVSILSFSLFVQGLWVPLVPSALAMGITGIGLLFYIVRPQKI